MITEARDYTNLNAELLKPGDIVIHNEEIVDRIQQLAKEIADKYEGQNLHLVGLLKGAFMVTAELAKALHGVGMDDITFDFMEVSSYGENQVSSNDLAIRKDISTPVTNRHVLLVDDVAETNRTVKGIHDHLTRKGASTIETFVLVEKNLRSEVNFKPDYVGFRIPSHLWIQGFGMDSPVEYGGLVQEHGRANPNIVKGPTRPTSGKYLL